MAKLEAMLEQRGIATPRELSEAVARCQLHGGDLTTSLLQFVSADETLLSAAVSECYGLPAASVGLLPAPDDAALRSLPRDVAERYCCFPIAASPGRLVLAVARPLDPALREELGAILGVAIEERVALEVRIRQALARFYGLPLSARNQRGIARLEGDVEGVGHETPLGLWSDTQLSTLPRPPSELPPGHRDSQRPPSVRPRARSEQPRLSSAPPNGGPRTSRRRGPMTLVQAREELGRTPSRNDVLDIFFAFASQFFEYSALFAVHNALAEGLDAWGKGADRETVLGIGVPLDLPSSLSEAAESCKVRLTRLAREGIDRTLMNDLQRQFNNKALVLPVSLRGRCAVLFYADNGEADVVEREAADVIALAPDVANALGRIILTRKREIARQRENADLSGSSLPPRRPSSPLDAPEPLSNENRSSPSASLRPSRPPPEGLGASEPSSGDDPVFLLSSPRARARVTPVPPQPRLSFPPVEKPPVAITHPARIIGNRPRLPSVIVDPQSADPEASERLTRAAAVTRAPTQARSSSSGASGRRPLVPPAADAPRTLTPPDNDRRRPPAVVLAASPEPRPAIESSDREPAPDAELSEAEQDALAEREALGATASNGWPPPIMDNSPPPRQQALTALVPIIIADPPKGRRGYTSSRSAAAARTGVKPSLARSGPQRPAIPPAGYAGPASPTVPSPARTRKLDVPASAGGGTPSPESARAVAMETPTLPAPANKSGAAAVARESSSSGASAIARETPALGDAVRAAATTGSPNGAPPPRQTNALARAAARAASASTPHASDNSQRPTAPATEPRVASNPFAARGVVTAASGTVTAPRESRPPAASAALPRSPSAAPPRAPSAAPASPARLDSAGALASAPRPAPVAPLPDHAPAGAPMVSNERTSSPPPAPAEAEAVSSAEARPGAARSVPITYLPSSEPAQPSSAAATTVPARARSTGAHAEETGVAGPDAPAPAPAGPAPAASGGLVFTSSFPPDEPSPESDALNAGWFTPGANGVMPSSTPAPRSASGDTLATATRAAPEAPAAYTPPAASTPSAAPTSSAAATSSAAPTSSAAATSSAAPSPSAAPTSSASSAAPTSSAAPSPSAAPTSSASSAAPTSSAAPSPSAAPTSSAASTPPRASTPVVSASPLISGASGAAVRPAMFPPPPPDGSDLEELVERVCQGNLKAVQDLARIGAPSLPQVMARFPGPVISERAGPTSRASECGPLLQALAAIGTPALSVVTQSSEHDDPRVRRWATLLLGEMPGPEACRAVVQRLADDVPRVHQAALDAARLLLASPAADLFRQTLFEVAEAEEAPLTLRLRTIEHVAKLKDSASVPRLIAFLAADMEPIVHKALWALTVVTRHDYGRDARGWTDFWHSNQSRHRVEWLIDALDDRDPRLRKAAADELRDEAGELYGYAENLARPERLEAQQKLRDWWKSTGAARHAPR